MRNHYVPKFLLRGFADGSGLWQFDIETGCLEPRNVVKAGQRHGFYSDGLEEGLLQRIDGEAGAIFGKGILGPKDEVLVEGDDKIRLARWLALFAIRTPRTFANFERHVADAAKDPQWAISIMYEGKDHVLAMVRDRSPDAYRAMVSEFGRLAGEELILAHFAGMIRDGRLKCLPNAKTSFVNYINEDRMNEFARRLLRYQWVWLRSDYGFIIGDNPLCRWSMRTGYWDHGVSRRETVITMPLSRWVCLRLQHRQSHAKRALCCSRELTRQYNQRQMLSSERNVYGPEWRLRPMAAKVVDAALRSGKLAAPPRFAP